MTAEEKITKIKKILEDTVGENHKRIPKEETKKELLQFTIAEIADSVADIEEMIHDIYDVVDGDWYVSDRMSRMQVLRFCGYYLYSFKL